ncbi:zinc finger, C2H2 type, partial [Teladorsagia circumcincta]
MKNKIPKFEAKRCGRSLGRTKRQDKHCKNEEVAIARRGTLSGGRSTEDIFPSVENPTKFRLEVAAAIGHHPWGEMYTMQSPTSPANDGRKRRRGELINPANTLDGLVARRADDTHEPFQKRYLTEQEAIEGPDDETEAKRMENDPDVSTRTCSTCGYVGKWISEMIRHKRVHTSERPFKCRYCSRTSKWKADLIRHVAKTHGIRVVSKYSRSKAFDQATTNLAERDDEDKPRIFACEPDKEPERQKQLPNMDTAGCEVTRPEPLLPGKTPLSYRCSQCYLEQFAGGKILVVARAARQKVCNYVLSKREPEATVKLYVPDVSMIPDALSTSSSDSMSPTRSRSECSPDSGVQIDLEEVDMKQISYISHKTINNNSDNENAIGKPELVSQVTDLFIARKYVTFECFNNSSSKMSSGKRRNPLGLSLPPTVNENEKEDGSKE